MSRKLITAKKYCQQQQIKLTPLREQILLLVISSSKPITAYAILDELKKQQPKAQAMTVYRILDYLLVNKLIHRIENLNAFMACCHLFEAHTSQWLICQICGNATECAITAFDNSIRQVEQQTGFMVKLPTIELLGVCETCQ